MPTIRLYKQHRYDEYYHIRRQVFTVEQQFDPSIELDEYDNLDREDVIHFAYWHSKLLIASARVILLADKEILVGRIATLKEYRHQGYASQLLRDIEVYFHNIGYEKVLIHSQLNAISFYEKNGYHPEGDPFIEADIEHQLVVKPI